VESNASWKVSWPVDKLR